MERITYNEVPAGLIEAMRQVQNYIDESGLDARLLELMRTRVSQINGCAYCLDMHHKLAIHYGETVQRLISVSAWREAPYYSDMEQAVLEFAERLTLVPEEKNHHTLHDALSKHFSKQEIGVLTLAVAQINSWNRLVASFGTTAGNFRVPE